MDCTLLTLPTKQTEEYEHKSIGLHTQIHFLLAYMLKWEKQILRKLVAEALSSRLGKRDIPTDINIYFLYMKNV